MSPQCERSHCFSSTRISASMDAGFAPGWMRPIKSSQWLSDCVQIALQQRFGVQRQKEIGRIVAQSVAKETRRSDSHHRKWLVIEIEDAADDGRIRSIPLLP